MGVLFGDGADENPNNNLAFHYEPVLSLASQGVEAKSSFLVKPLGFATPTMVTVGDGYPLFDGFQTVSFRLTWLRTVKLRVYYHLLLRYLVRHKPFTKTSFFDLRCIRKGAKVANSG